MPTDTPEIRRIIALVRQAGTAGCTEAYLVSMTGGTEQAIRAALLLQVQAGYMETEKKWDGERYLHTLYRMRTGLPS